MSVHVQADSHPEDLQDKRLSNTALLVGAGWDKFINYCRGVALVTRSTLHDARSLQASSPPPPPPPPKKKTWAHVLSNVSSSRVEMKQASRERSERHVLLWRTNSTVQNTLKDLEWLENKSISCCNQSCCNQSCAHLLVCIVTVTDFPPKLQAKV